MTPEEFEARWNTGELCVSELLEIYTQALVDKILADEAKQGAGGQYSVGMKRAAFLINPLAGFPWLAPEACGDCTRMGGRERCRGSHIDGLTYTPVPWS